MHKDSKHPLYVAFLWHMHQPYYRDRRTGVCLLPWTRLHGLKNYYDIPAISEEFPDIRQTFNMVPSLITQLDEYTLHGRSDVFLDVARQPAEHLTAEEQQFLIRNFFLANTDTMVNPYPRYRQLLEKRGLFGTLDEATQAVPRFKTRDFLDLQVWFHLTWTGHTLRNHPEIQALFDKGQRFTEDDKLNLLRLQQDFLSEVVPYYRRLQDSGQIEVSISPFYHPILPLLCNTQVAREALPDIALPSNRFMHPEDAAVQVQRSMAFYKERFGRVPRGMWPSEGSVSPAVLPIVADAGLQWLATDDEILAHSLRQSGRRPAPGKGVPPHQRYRPHRVGGVTILFRDHLLSDRIGFVYSRWDAADAADDFIHRLLEIRHQLPATQPWVVPIILDGENAWEYYANHGRDFLRSLYEKLSNTPDIKTATFSEALELTPAEPLERLFSGSWIGHSFATWIGHSEKNTGWICLDEARRRLVEFEQTASPEHREHVREARESLYIAEGSDWFWWYGDDHSSMNDAEFDLLFRTHVGNVYHAIGDTVPERLRRPIRQPHVIRPTREPMGQLKPHLDGRATSYYEWLPSGYYDVRGGRGSMHQAETFLKRIHYGFDTTCLYLRIDTASAMTDEAYLAFRVQIRFTLPAQRLMVIASRNDATFSLTIDGEETPEAQASVDRLVEIALPLSLLKARPQDTVEFDLSVLQGEQEFERWPHTGVIQFTIPDPKEDDVWFV